MYIKRNQGEIILAKIRKVEKTMIKYPSYTNRLRFSFGCHHSKILPKYQQLKSGIKIERSKIILQRAGNLLLQERISNVIRDKLKNSIGQLRAKILESKTPEEFHPVEKIHENLYKKSFELTKKRHTEI